MIRPYKGLPDAVEAVLGVPGARLLVAGDPRIPLDELRTAAGDRAEWRLGYLDERGDRRRARGRDRRGLPLSRRARPVGRAPAGDRRRRARRSSTTSAASVRSSARSAAGRVVPPGDVDGLEAGAARAAGRRRRARRGACRRRAGPRRTSPGTERRPSTSRSTRSSREIPAARSLPRPRRAAARPVRRRRCGAARARRPRRRPPGTRLRQSDAEEAYGDYQLVVDAIADRLLDIRESYARSLDDEASRRVRGRVHARGDPPLSPLRHAARRSRRAVGRPVFVQAVSSSVGSPGGRGCRKRASLRWVEASARRPCCMSDRPRA